MISHIDTVQPGTFVRLINSWSSVHEPEDGEYYIVVAIQTNAWVHTMSQHGVTRIFDCREVEPVEVPLHIRMQFAVCMKWIKDMSHETSKS